MDLNKPITIGKAKKKNAAESAPLKTTMNFAAIGEKPKTNWGLAVPGIVVIAICAALFAKFGVIDRYAALSAAQGRVSDLQREIDDINAQIAAAEELSEQFYHYTWSGMTADEKEAISRVSVANLVSVIEDKGVTVHSASLSGTTFTLSVTADSLESVSALIEALRSEPAVATASMTSARTGEETHYYQEKSGNAGESEDGDADGDEEENWSSYVTQYVDAQLTIKLNTLTELQSAEKAAENSGN